MVKVECNDRNVYAIKSRRCGTVVYVGRNMNGASSRIRRHFTNTQATTQVFARHIEPKDRQELFEFVELVDGTNLTDAEINLAEATYINKYEPWYNSEIINYIKRQL